MGYKCSERLSFIILFNIAKSYLFQMSMSVVMEFTFVSKSATIPMVLITASVIMATGLIMTAMHVKVSTKSP